MLGPVLADSERTGLAGTLCRGQARTVHVEIDMKKIFIAALALAITLPWLGGCGKSDPAKVSARSTPATRGTEKVVTRWKESDLKIPGYGMIIEQEGSKVSAALYRVEPGEGFVIKEKASEGKYYADTRQIVFPLYMQGMFSVDDWIAAQGSHVLVPFDPQATSLAQATNLAGNLKDLGRKSSFQFVRLPSESLPSTLNTASPSAP